MKVVFREETLADLDEIARFIAGHDTAAANRVIARIHRTIYRTIAVLPLSGRLNPANNTREYAVPGLPYLVITCRRGISQISLPSSARHAIPMPNANHDGSRALPAHPARLPPALPGCHKLKRPCSRKS